MDNIVSIERIGNLTRNALNIWKEVDRKPRTCPFCTLEFKEHDPISLCITNHTMFPNILMHSSCIEGDMAEKIKFLVQDYQESTKYRHWF